MEGKPRSHGYATIEHKNRASADGSIYSYQDNNAFDGKHMQHKIAGRGQGSSMQGRRGIACGGANVSPHPHVQRSCLTALTNVSHVSKKLIILTIIEKQNVFHTHVWLRFMGGVRTSITLHECWRAQVLNRARTTFRTQDIRDIDVCRVGALTRVIETLIALLWGRSIV